MTANNPTQPHSDVNTDVDLTKTREAFEKIERDLQHELERWDRIDRALKECDKAISEFEDSMMLNTIVLGACLAAGFILSVALLGMCLWSLLP